MATNWKSSWGIMQLRSFSVYNSNLDTRFEAGSPSPFSETNCEDQELKECEHAGPIIQLKHDWMWKLCFIWLPIYLQTLGFVVAVNSVQVYHYCIRQVQKFRKKLQVQRWDPYIHRELGTRVPYSHENTDPWVPSFTHINGTWIFWNFLEVAE